MNRIAQETGKRQSLKERSHRPNSHHARYTAEGAFYGEKRRENRRKRRGATEKLKVEYYRRCFFERGKFASASVKDLNEKVKRYLAWSNNKPMRILGDKSPLQTLKSKLRQSA